MWPAETLLSSTIGAQAHLMLGAIKGHRKSSGLVINYNATDVTVRQGESSWHVASWQAGIHLPNCCGRGTFWTITYTREFLPLEISVNSAQLLWRNRTTFHKPPSMISSTLSCTTECQWGLHMLLKVYLGTLIAPVYHSPLTVADSGSEAGTKNTCLEWGENTCWMGCQFIKGHYA